MLSKLTTLHSLLRPPRAHGDHQARLQSFYGPQARGYDTFREDFLRGRETVMRAIPIPKGGTVADFGGGTGRSVEWLEPRLSQLGSVTIVDMCPALLRVANNRILSKKWANVTTCLADIARYEHSAGKLDAITLSYSLSMVPNWFDVVERAWANLKPGGYLGIVDFYVSPKWPSHGRVRHSAFTRAFWPLWFNYSNVFLNPDHLEYLTRRFHIVRLDERLLRMPYMCGLKVPYYIFIGRKAQQELPKLTICRE